MASILHPVSAPKIAPCSHHDLSLASRGRKLRAVSDKKLLEGLLDLSGRERALEIDTLMHLIEMDRRKLHTDLGYRSLFAYATGALGYSKSAAGRRIQAARCISRFAVVARCLANGSLSMTAVCLVARIIDESNAETLLKEVVGRTETEVELVVARYAGPVQVRERVCPIRLPVNNSGSKVESGTQVLSSSPSPSPGVLDLDGSSTKSLPLGSASDLGQSRGQGMGAGGGGGQRAETHTPTPTDRAEILACPRPECTVPGYKVHLVLDEQLMKKLKRAQDLVSRDSKSSATLVETLGKALDVFLSKNCPVEREARRKSRRNLREEAAEARQGNPLEKLHEGPGEHLPESGAEATAETKGDGSTRPETPRCALFSRRAIPAGIRDFVMVRDGGVCTYVGRNGRPCRSKRRVQIDHRIPVALGGETVANNLRCLCRTHNQREADRLLGERFMDGHRTGKGAAAIAIGAAPNQGARSHLGKKESRAADRRLGADGHFETSRDEKSLPVRE